jgi:hypothetical protein
MCHAARSLTALSTCSLRAVSSGNCPRISRPKARRTTTMSSFSAPVRIPTIAGVLTRIHHALHAESAGAGGQAHNADTGDCRQPNREERRKRGQRLIRLGRGQENWETPYGGRYDRPTDQHRGRHARRRAGSPHHRAALGNCAQALSITQERHRQWRLPRQTHHRRGATAGRPSL